MAIVRFEQLEVWQVSHRLVLDIYKVTKEFPRQEQFGLISQMRRCAASVPANIAEGFKRRSKGEKMRFYNIAEGSLEELRYYLILSRDLGYLPQADVFNPRLTSLGRMLTRLNSAIRVRI